MKKINFLILISLVFIVFFNSFAFANSKPKKTVKVGYPIQKNITDFDKYGNPIGYTADYLKEIQKYTNWEYEYVQVDGNINTQLDTLLTMLKNGEIDLMGTINHNDALAKIFDYPNYSYGSSYYTIAVNESDYRWLYNDFSHWQKIRIGYCPGLESRISLIEEFAKINGFQYELVHYNSPYEILDAVRNGELDAIIQKDISLEDGLKNITKFSPSPYYFATTKGNVDIVQGLTTALSNIDSANLYFQDQLYQKYFSSNETFQISEEKKKLIQDMGTINIAMIDGNAPIQYKDGNEFKGVAMSYLNKFSQATGLKYNIVPVNTYNELQDIVQNKENKIGFILALPTNSPLIYENHLTLTLPFLSSQLLQTTRLNNNADLNAPEIIVYNNLYFLNLINKNKVQSANLDSLVLNYYLQKKDIYKNISIIYNNAENIQYSMVLVDESYKELLPIYNGFINSISNQTRVNIINENSNAPVKYTFAENFKIYLKKCFVFLPIVLTIIILLYLRHIRNHNQVLNEIALQHKRLNELFGLMEECILEYNYKTDVLKIQNNKILFDRENEIKNCVKDNKYEFLTTMLKNQTDDTQEIMLDVWYKLTVKIIRDDKNNPLYAIGKVVNADDEIRQRKNLEDKAKRDGLTNLYNRNAAEELISSILKVKSEGIMLLFDIDNFKSINDTLGHQEGDLFLTEFAKYLKSYFRKEDIVCRLGGDEFLVFITYPVPEASLKTKLDELIRNAHKELFNKYKDIDVSMSIGASYVNKQNNNYLSLYNSSDKAMYEAKNNGKNNWTIN